MNFSVCISVYKNDKLEFVNESLLSILNQTFRPAEIILVVDGPVTSELDAFLSQMSLKEEIIHLIRLSENQGLGNALKIAVENAKYDIVARMDSDDISLPDRFEKQIKCFENDNTLSIVGGTIREFIETPENAVAKRMCPLEDKEIKKYMKTRCGLNHVTVMFRKADVLKAGNYQDWFWNEDYYLWLRMILASCKFKNLGDTLVSVRVGKDMYERRGGKKYFKSEVRLQKYMLDNNIIAIPRYIANIIIRFIIQIVLPSKVRGFVFQKILRKK